ncbi:MAG: LysR family transcriptional regulator [Betaproteobacteria bacterium]|nr:LysR family transcriptional regulator [Betaproteobacteria bacterium]
MDLRVLKLFVQVCELNSFTKAAVSAGVTQPTISRAIGELEQEFGGPLFYRTGRGVTLTDLGETAFPRARALLMEADQLAADVQAVGRSPSGVVSLGVLPSMMQPLVASLFEDLRKRMPGIRLRVFEGFSGQIERWIAEGHVDLGLLSRYRAAVPGKDDVLLRSPLMLVRAADSPRLPGRVEFARLAKLPLVLPSVPNGLRVLLEEAARKRGVSLNVVLEADSLNAQKDVVRRCRCYTVLTAQAIFEEQATGKMCSSAITKPELFRLAVLTTSQQRPLSRAGREVLRTIHQLVGRLIEQGVW